MIDLISGDDRTGFGVRCALDIERIPYRRIARAEEFDAHLLVIASADVTRHTAQLARRVPTVVIGAPSAVTGELFGVSRCRMTESPATISLEEPVWPETTRTRARRFGKDALRIPLVPAFTPERPASGRILASYRGPDGRAGPAVVRNAA